MRLMGIILTIFIVGCTRVPTDSSDITEGRTKYPPAGMYCYCVASESTLTFCKDSIKRVEALNATKMYQDYCKINKVQ